MPELLEILSRSGVDRFLRSLVTSSDSAFARSELESNLADMGVPDARLTADDLITNRLLQQVGVRFSLSHYGHRVTLLLEAMSGGDIQDVIRRLRRLEGFEELYEL